jgi:hypothetical protein
MGAPAENSDVGFAKQTAVNTPNVTDASFQYFMFGKGGIGANNQYIPADDSIGSGSLLPSIEKGGVFSAGAFEFVPRPVSIGSMLYGVLGKAAVPTADGTGWKHVITIDTASEFTLPYFTFRSAPGDLWGETFQDCRIMSLGLNWKAADMVRAQMAVIGGLPTPNVTKTLWAPDTHRDNAPVLLAPTTVITGFNGATLKILRGAINFGGAFPLDEQWITGSYSPDGIDLVSRQVSISLLMKVADATLYNKMSYDPSNGAAWVASALKDGDIVIHFKSSKTYDTNKPYALKFAANSQTQASGNGNIAWTVAPISLQSGKLVTMMVTGTVLKNAFDSASPVSIELYNNSAAKIDPAAV